MGANQTTGRCASISKPNGGGVASHLLPQSITGMNNDQILAIYESISRLTRQMLAAARGGEWDALVRLERDCSGLFARLFTSEDEAPRSDEFQRRKAALIRGVLDDDAEIRLLVEPWLH